MKIAAVIPCRFASQRFPGKPLATLLSKPLVQWVYDATKRTDLFSDIVIATDDHRIAEVVTSFGGKFIMTSPNLTSGTDRVAEAVAHMKKADVIVNVQGDQPLVSPGAIRSLIAPFLESDPPLMTTVACPLPDSKSCDPNTVKVLCDRHFNAIYFSRAPIPYFRSNVQVPVYQHVGLYAFQTDFLTTFSKLLPTPLELAEQLEQLRAIENGFSIRVGLIDEPVSEVNTPADLLEVELLLKQASK